MGIHLNFRLLMISLVVALAGGFGAASGLQGSVRIAPVVLGGSVAAGLFLFMHAAAALLITRAEASKRLNGRLNNRKNRQKALEEKLLANKQLKLLTASSASSIRPWMGFAIPGGIREVEKLRLNLHAAGYKKPGAVKGFVIARMVTPIFLLGAGLYISGMLLESGALRVLAGLALAAGGWVAVPYQLGQKARERGQAVGVGMADAVDILTIYVSAGVPFDAAIEDAAPKLEHICKPVSEELQTLSKELRMTQSRAGAFDAFLHRADSPPVREFVAIVKQADADGTPMSAALTKLSETLRKERVLEADRKAAKIPILLVGPQMTFAFPAFLTTILFSGVYEAAQNFAKIF